MLGLHPSTVSAVGSWWDLNCNKAFVLASFRDDSRHSPSDNPWITVPGVRRAVLITSSQQVASKAHYRKLALSFSNVTGDSRGKELFSLPVGLYACRKIKRESLSTESRIYQRARAAWGELYSDTTTTENIHKGTLTALKKTQKVFMATICQGILKEHPEQEATHQDPVTSSFL